MPKVVKLYISSALIGFVAAAAFVGLILVLDVAGIGHLVAGSDVAVMAVVVFWILNGIVFSGVQFAYRITILARRATQEGNSDTHSS
jgi:hypothetical protein